MGWSKGRNLTTPSSPAWLRIYRYFTEQPPPIGTVVAHRTLAQIAGLDFENERHRSGYYHAVQKACIELENENSRTLLTERGEGYRYAAGNMHIEKAITGALAIRRRLSRVAGTAATVDVSGMSQAELDRVRHAQALILRQTEQMNQVYFQPPAWHHAQHAKPEVDSAASGS